jgi:hypothetical protein
MNWSYLIARLISTIVSWIDAGNLRTEVYRLKDQNEIMYTALNDIRRMDKEGRMGWHAKRTIDIVDGQDEN